MKANILSHGAVRALSPGTRTQLSGAKAARLRLGRRGARSTTELIALSAGLPSIPLSFILPNVLKRRDTYPRIKDLF